MGKIILGVLLAVVVGGTYGIMSRKSSSPKWALVGSDDARGLTFYLDKNSIVRSGSTSNAWMKTVVSHPDAGRYAYALSLTTYNCGENTAAMKTLVFYSPDGTATTEQREPDFQPVIPESNGELFAKAACA